VRIDLRGPSAIGVGDEGVTSGSGAGGAELGVGSRDIDKLGEMSSGTRRLSQGGTGGTSGSAISRIGNGVATVMNNSNGISGPSDATNGFSNGHHAATSSTFHLATQVRRVSLEGEYMYSPASSHGLEPWTSLGTSKSVKDGKRPDLDRGGMTDGVEDGVQAEGRAVEERESAAPPVRREEFVRVVLQALRDVGYV
jgi:hypothetical protein